ncbi:MAG: oligosaccharide flippase family protein [Leptolyngbyaceae cyanobacterium SL_7_1]|nr:oligosaccharide flippase family protein [Leptolyngbyaceae cyanobacterium SL_7_1]
MSSLFLQSAYFLIIARSLGAEQYGLFVGVMALIKLLVPFANWGAPHILMKHVARDQTVFRQFWGNTLWITGVLGTLFLIAILLINQFVLPNQFPGILLLSIGLAELIFARVHEAAIKSFMATDRLGLDAQINILLSVNGLIAALCLLVFFPSPSAIAWGVLYLISRFTTALISLILVCRALGTPQPNLALMKSEIIQGFYFSVGLSSQTIYNDIDKTMLASISTLSATGIYGAAYRIIEVAMIPIVSLLGATYAHFFRKGAVGIRGSLAFAKRIVPVASGYGVLAAVGLWLCAPLTPFILGEEYTTSVEALHWLAPIILFKAIQFFAADTLTGAGLQGARSALQAGAAGLNVGLNLWLIPLYSWRGAAWASLATDGLLMVGLWALTFFYYRQETSRSSINTSK